MNEIEDIWFVPLGQEGKFAIIDREDGGRILAHRWQLRNGYASRVERTPEGRRYVSMHGAVMGVALDKHTVGDHINRKKLDNRKSNLRPASRAQNAANTEGRPGPSGYRGVQRSGRGTWQARLKCRRREAYLGTWSSAEEAASAYDVAARECLGEFAFQNLSPDGARS